MNRIRENTKFVTALGGFFALLGNALVDGTISNTEGRGLVLAAVSAGLVWLFPNAKEYNADSDTTEEENPFSGLDTS